MATQTILNAATSNIAIENVTLYEHTGPCAVWLSGVMDGATVVVVGAAADDTGEIVSLSHSMMAESEFVNRCGSAVCDGQGTYYLGAFVRNAGALTSVTVKTTQ